MPNFIAQLVAICFFKAAPQDLPTSQNLLVVNAVFAAAAIFLTSAGGHEGISQLQLAIAQVCLLGLLMWLILSLKGFSTRWVQTMTAVYGCSILFQLLGWPVAAMTVGEIKELGGLSSLYIVLLSLWSLAVTAYILRHALEVTLGRGLLLAFGCQSLVLLMLSFFFGSLIPAS